MTKEYYAANADKIKATAKSWTIRQRRRLKDYIINLKSDRTCQKCNTSYPWFVMTLGKPKISIAVRKGVSTDTLHELIKDCDIMCSNCRRIDDSNKRTLTDRETLS